MRRISAGRKIHEVFVLIELRSIISWGLVTLYLSAIMTALVFGGEGEGEIVGSI